MDKNAIMAEISAQSKLVNGIAIDQTLVTEIDRHMKDMENQLNEKLVHMPTKVIIQDFVPKASGTLTKINDEIWNGLHFDKKWLAQRSLHEEISFEKTAKGYGFFYTLGDVTFDVGLCEEPDGVDWYYRIIDDKREVFKVTGASVEIKLQAFRHLSKLLAKINEQANQIGFSYRQAPTSGNSIKPMSLDMTEAFTPAQLEEINKNYNRTLF